MDLATIGILSAATVLGSLLTISRVIPWKYLRKYSYFTDLILTGLFFKAFMGAGQGGMLIAVCSGLMLAIVMFVAHTMHKRSHPEEYKKPDYKVGEMLSKLKEI